MKDLFEYLQELWKIGGYPGIVAMLALCVAILLIVRSMLAQAWTLRKKRRLKRDLFPFYSPQEIQRATQSYVETKCQNVAPFKAEEPGHTDPAVVKENVLPGFLKKVFHPEQADCQFYIVLADSGMGKTTFLINLYLRYFNQYHQPADQIKLFPFGFPGLDQEIEKIPDDEKRQTILLLDGFDEDIQAGPDYKARLEELVQKVMGFRGVVITCRTQFFPSAEEEPEETGVMRYGVEAGERVFYKFYLSPFDEKDIRTYLKKRIPWFQMTKRHKAQQIGASCPNLMARPMVLSCIKDLLQSQRSYPAAYLVYGELINNWIEQESHKVPLKKREHYKEELYWFSHALAMDLYHRREERQGRLLISGKEIQRLAGIHDINLDVIEMKSHSLLQRTVRGEYKFSHKSILEYFLAKEAFLHARFRQELDFKAMHQAQVFFDEMIWEKLTLPFFNRDDLNGEYRLKDGKLEVLTGLSTELLPQITCVKLREWNPSDDMLLFKGLKRLEWLYLPELQMPSTPKDDLQHCKIGGLPRNTPLIVSKNEFRQMFRLDENHRPLQYTQNEFEDRGEVVIDHAAARMWQKSGSSQYMTYNDVQKYIETLNQDQFAGYNDWRLPTISELLTLLESEKQSNTLHLNPLFDAAQSWCWSADKRMSNKGSPEGAWNVNFHDGCVYWYQVEETLFARAIRL